MHPSQIRLPRLYPHKGGGWLYQSPRTMFTTAYLYYKGFNLNQIVGVVKKHLEYVARLRYTREKYWLVERLDGLGYVPQTRYAKPVESLVQEDLIKYFVNALSIDVKTLSRIIDDLLDILGAKKVEDIAFLPPVLTLPEKILLLKSISTSRKFALKDTMKALALISRGFKPKDVVVGGKDTANMEIRLRTCYLNALHLVAGRRKPRITGMGYAVAFHLELGDNKPWKTYLEYLADTMRLGYLVALDVVALEIHDPDKYSKLVELYKQVLLSQDLKDIAQYMSAQSRNIILHQPSDIKGLSMISITEHIDKILWQLEI